MPRKPLYYDSENGKKEVLGTSGSFEQVPDAPTSALPTEYPATYAAMQASITSDPSTKRDFFVTGENVWYRYDGTNVVSTTPKNNIDTRIVYFGDSITANGYSLSGTSYAFKSYGFTTYAGILSDGQYYMPVGGNLGVNGNTTTQMLARVGSVIALSPKVVTVLGGTNDLTGSASSSTIINNLKQIYSVLQSAGITVLAIPILPRFSANVLNASNETSRQTVNDWIRSQKSRTLIVVDAETTMNNSSYFSDGLHPNHQGSYILGGLVASALNYLAYNKRLPDVIGADNGYVNGFNLSGTGGTLTTATGQAATSWTLRSSSALGATVTGSKTTDNNLEQQVITLSGNYNGNGGNMDFFQDLSISSQFQEGDTIEVVADVEIITALQNVISIASLMIVNTPTPATTIATSSSLTPDTSTELMPLPLGRYVLRTPPVKITGGAVGSVRASFAMNFVYVSSSTPISGAVKIHKLAIRKCPSEAVKTTDLLVTQKRRRAIADVASTLAVTDYILAYTSLTATRAVTLPSAASAKDLHFIIKDEAGTAGTNNITIVGTVNGSVNPIAINSNYGTYKLYSNGTAWFTE